MEADRFTRWRGASIRPALHPPDGFYERLGPRVAAAGVHSDHQ